MTDATYDTDMTYDIKNTSEKKLLKNNDFLFVWDANLIIYKVNFLIVFFFTKKPCLHSSRKFDIKHLQIKLFKKCPKKNSSKIMFYFMNRMQI